MRSDCCFSSGARSPLTMSMASSVLISTYAFAYAFAHASALFRLCEENATFMMVVCGAVETWRPWRAPFWMSTRARTSARQKTSGFVVPPAPDPVGDAEAVTDGDGDGVAPPGDR